MSLDLVELLLLESGDCLIAVDPESVRWIDYAPEGCVGYRLEELLDLPDPIRTGHRRGLSVLDSGSEHLVWVERLIGIEEMESSHLHRLPLVMRNFGAPSWLLGVGRRGDRLALLVDLPGAIRAIQGECST